MRRRPLALRTRGMLAFGALALAVSTVVAVATYEIARATLVAQRERAAQRQAFLNARSVRSGLAGGLVGDGRLLDRVQIATGGAALLRMGEEWYSTSVAVDRSDVSAGMLAAVAEGSVARQRLDTSIGPVVAVALPVDASTTYVELVPTAEVADALSLVARGAVVVVAASTGLGVLVGRWLAARVLRPVRRAADAADRIRQGALDRRLDDEDDPDLAPLVDSFNEMVDGLQTRIDREARFASDVSHELRSPLATMSAALSVARRSAGDNEREALDALGAEIDRFNQLVVELLEISRSESGSAAVRREPVDPVELVGSVLRASGRSAVPVVREGPPDRVELDKRRIGQAITNLLDNADHHGGGATQVLVELTPRSVRFVVDDAGPGVPETERSYVFGRFARGVDVTVAGTGLGLALVAEHARAHGGRASVEDSPCGGARFVVEIER